MHTFAVWAPAAARVLLSLPQRQRRVPMTADADGWWVATVEDAGHGTDYAFSIDGGDEHPDPRSAWQPYGVHGPSRVFDVTRHEWADDGWAGVEILGRVSYELHVGTFTPQGTFDAAIERLDHLVDLGVDVVELLPVAAFPGDHGWGYDGVHLYAVQQSYGGPGGLQRFVDACHGRGLGVCLDVVYNHLGPEGNYLPGFGPYFTGAHHTPWGEAVNLDDKGAAQVRRWILDNAVRWFEDFHMDGLRLDAVHALVDTSERHLLAELSDEIGGLSRRLGRPLTLIAESDLNDPAMIEPVSSGGFGMHGQWDDDVHHAVHAMLTGERAGYYADFGSTAVLARTFTEAFRHAGDWSSFRGTTWGRPIDRHRHRGHQFVVCLQNHDQVGNRAAGDRTAATLTPGRLAAGAALLLTSPFTPLLFMGEEWGASTPWQFFTDYPDPELTEAVREGRHREFAEHGWRPQDVPDPQDPATFWSSQLRWDERDSGIHAPLLMWYRNLIALRRAEPDLRDDDLSTIRVDYGDTWVAVYRGRFRVMVNLAPVRTELPAPLSAQPVLTWGDVSAGEHGWTFEPDAVAVLRLA